MGVDAFPDWAVQLKLRIKTVPQKQWDVGRELRKRLRQRSTKMARGSKSHAPIRSNAAPTPWPMPAARAQ